MPSQSDNAIQFSFDSTNPLPSEADLRSAVATPENRDYEAPPQDKPAPEVKVETTTPEAETPTTIEEKSAPTSTEDLKTYTIKVNGEEMTVTEADLKAGHMRHRDYTQKTQQLAAEKAAWEAKEAQYKADLQAIDSFLRDKQAYADYAKKAFGIDLAAQPTPVPQLENPTNPTLADIAKISAYNAEQVRLSMARDFEARLEANARENAERIAQSQAQVAQEKLANEVETHVEALLKQHPLLARFEDIREDLMGDAAKRLPKGASIADAKAELSAAAERRMAVMQSLITEDKKAAAVQAAKLKQNSPEPPGGSPAKRQEGRKLTLNTSDKKDFLASAQADVQAFLDANS